MTQRIRPRGGRSNPRATERKSAGADKLVRYLENARYGRVFRPEPRADSTFALMDVASRRKFLFDKLRDLQGEKEAMMDQDGDSESELATKSRRRQLKEGVISMEILETLKAIEELENG